MWAKHAQSVVASQACPHSCTVSRQLLTKLHGLLPLAFRQRPTPRATDRAVAGGGEGGEGSEGGEGAEGGSTGNEGDEGDEGGQGGGDGSPGQLQPAQSKP